MKKISFGLIVFFIMLPVFVLAVECDKYGLNCTAEGNFSNADVSVFVGNIIKAVLALLGVIVLIFMVYGGYLWMMSGGNDQMVKKSKDILINAVIGLVIVLAAYAITTFVVSRIYSAANSSGSTTKTCSEFGTSYACMNEADGHGCGSASDCSDTQKCCIPFNFGG